MLRCCSRFILVILSILILRAQSLLQIPSNKSFSNFTSLCFLPHHIFFTTYSTLGYISKQFGNVQYLYELETFEKIKIKAIPVDYCQNITIIEDGRKIMNFEIIARQLVKTQISPQIEKLTGILDFVKLENRQSYIIAGQTLHFYDQQKNGRIVQQKNQIHKQTTSKYQGIYEFPQFSSKAVVIKTKKLPKQKLICLQHWKSGQMIDGRCHQINSFEQYTINVAGNNLYVTMPSFTLIFNDTLHLVSSQSTKFTQFSNSHCMSASSTYIPSRNIFIQSRAALTPPNLQLELTLGDEEMLVWLGTRDKKKKLGKVNRKYSQIYGVWGKRVNKRNVQMVIQDKNSSVSLYMIEEEEGQKGGLTIQHLFQIDSSGMRKFIQKPTIIVDDQL